MIFKFGKHKNKDHRFVPSGYLKYIAESFSEKTEADKVVIQACDTEWQRREKAGKHITNEEFYGH